jgi:hypothetical protein
MLGGDARVLELARTHGMHVNDLDPLKQLPTRWGCLAILSTYPNVETFLDEFRVHHPRELQRSRVQDEDLLSYSLSSFGVSKSDVGGFECDVLDHYRRMRNHLLHKAHEDESKRDKSLRESLATRRARTRYAGLSAPNGPTELCFDDFALLTRSFKHFSREFCARAAPSDDELLSVTKRDVRLIRGLREAGRDHLVVTRRLTNYLRSNYGFPKTAESVANRLLDGGLLAQP